MILTKTCPECHEPNSVDIPQAALDAYRKGRHIQDAWPEATSGQREALITGYHDECWDSLFELEDEDDWASDEVTRK